jgi:hypothetical protein
MRQVRIREHLVVGAAGKLHRVALADAQDRAGKPCALAVLDAEHCRFDGAGADIDASRDGHVCLPSACPK